jgi:hypothetical protein
MVLNGLCFLANMTMVTVLSMSFRNVVQTIYYDGRDISCSDPQPATSLSCPVLPAINPKFILTPADADAMDRVAAMECVEDPQRATTEAQLDPFYKSCGPAEAR